MSAAALFHRRPRGSVPIPYSRYGALELKQASRAHMAYGVSLSALFSTLVLLTVAMLLARAPHQAPPTIQIRINWPGPPHHPVPPGPRDVPPRPPQTIPPTGPATVISVPDLPDHTSTEIAPPDLPPPSLPLERGEGSGPAGTSGPGPSTGTAPDGVSLTSAAGTWTPHDTEPELIAAPRPDYPEIAKRAMIEGKVRLWLLVGKDGRVARVDVREGVTMLSPAAVEAARGYIFKPALAGGHPVAVWVEESFDFRILP